MKIPIWLVCLLIGFYSNLHAQEKAKTEFGVKAGLNFAELFGENSIPESDRKEGYSFGTYLTINLSEEFKIQPEIIWSLQGEKTESKGRYDISYINVPVLFKWVEGDFYTELGPQLGILTINTSKSVPEELQLTNFETFELAVCGGLGYKVWEDWSFGIRYWQGLTNIVEGQDLKNSVIYLGVSYWIF